MCKISQQLLTINEYTLFKNINQNIKILEVNINNYQCKLRKNIHNKQIEVYNNIGKKSLQNFYKKYDNKLHEFNLYKQERRMDFEEKKKEDINWIENQMNNLSHTIKVKPKKQLKEFQIQEKLVALEERIEEANNFKKQIKILKKKEEDRLNRIYQKNIQLKKNQYLESNKKYENYINYKLINDENKLKIKMAKENDILSKKMALHMNNILKIQKFSYKDAYKKGNTYGDWINLKSRLSKQNKWLQNYKCTTQKKLEPAEPKNLTIKNENTSSVVKFPTKKSINSFKIPNLKTNSALNKLKGLKKSKFIIRFYIRQKFGVDIPCNIKNHNMNNKENVGKIEKYLRNSGNNNTETPKISKLYNDFLEEVSFDNELK